MPLESNLILDTDSYKASHFLQYPPGVQGQFNYLESRGGKFPETVFFGLQYILKEYFSKRITPEMVKKADHFFKMHGEPFNRDGWMYIAHELGGRLPLKIRAMPEGSVVPTHHVLMTVESTDPKAHFVVGHLETPLMRVWYPITVATNSFNCKRTIWKYLKETSDDAAAEIMFKLHDFGSRGVSSQESAGIGGASHLVNFMGSDTVWGVLFANEYYMSNMAGFSIPAAEHSSITAWGKDREVDAYRNMLQQFAKPGGLVAVVSDSYDVYNACEHLWGEQLKQEVIDSGATVIIRPDSGDPATVVRNCLDILAAKFGYTMNSKGYKVLNNVRIIQGDGINFDSIDEILNAVTMSKYSASNVAFGMGGGLLQQVNRDTQKFAYKCSAIQIDGKWQDVYKDPVTDPGKKSKRGLLDTIKSGDVYETRGLLTTEPHSNSALETVFYNGEIIRQYTLDEIRKRASAEFE